MSGQLKLQRKPCERPSCALFGQVHPRCKAHAKGPRLCVMFPMHGQLVCYRHGGKAPNSIAFAKRRQALDAVKSHVSRIVAYDGDDVTAPEEGLLMQVRWSRQISVALAEVCEALIADSDLTTKSAGESAQLNALMKAWADERVYARPPLPDGARCRHPAATTRPRRVAGSATTEGPFPEDRIGRPLAGQLRPSVRPSEPRKGHGGSWTTRRHLDRSWRIRGGCVTGDVEARQCQHIAAHKLRSYSD